MPDGSCKLSDIMQEMAQLLLRRPERVPSTEAAHVALFLANVAWNETVGLVHDRDASRAVWGTIEASNPNLWSEFKSIDIEKMIDELAEYKQKHYAADRRRILTCGIPDGKVRVEWVPAAAEGADSKWEMQLFGLVRTGAREEAIRFLQETKGLSRRQATRRVAEIAAGFGMN